MGPVGARFRPMRARAAPADDGRTRVAVFVIGYLARELLDRERAFHSSLFVSRLGAEVGVRAGFVDSERGHSLLARLCADLYWL